MNKITTRGFQRSRRPLHSAVVSLSMPLTSLPYVPCKLNCVGNCPCWEQAAWCCGLISQLGPSCKKAEHDNSSLGR